MYLQCNVTLNSDLESQSHVLCPLTDNAFLHHLHTANSCELSECFFECFFMIMIFQIDVQGHILFDMLIMLVYMANPASAYNLRDVMN